MILLLINSPFPSNIIDDINLVNTFKYQSTRDDILYFISDEKSRPVIGEKLFCLDNIMYNVETNTVHAYTPLFLGMDGEGNIKGFSDKKEILEKCNLIGKSLNKNIALCLNEKE